MGEATKFALRLNAFVHFADIYQIPYPDLLFQIYSKCHHHSLCVVCEWVANDYTFMETLLEDLCDHRGLAFETIK